MKTNKKIYLKTISIALLIFAFVGCEDMLEEEPYSQYSPDNFMTTESGINSLLVSAYDNIQYVGFRQQVRNFLAEITTDIAYQKGGGQNRHAQLFIDFTWHPAESWFSDYGWNKPYRAIRDANLVLEFVDGLDIDSSEKGRIKGEAKSIRAIAYYFLYGWFGPVPLIKSSSDDLYPARPSEDEIKTFIEDELTGAADLLPLEQDDYGRITKGGALATLCKFYLNTKQWQKCANTAQKIIALNYELFPDYTILFLKENDENSEYILVFPTVALSEEGNTWMGLSRPPQYPILSNQRNFASDLMYYDDFVNSFDTTDVRRELFLTEYVNIKGDSIELLGENKSNSHKFDDPDSEAQDQGNDWPIIRYADILLARAEALNELNGPSQEAINLINLVRARAGVDLLSVSDFDQTSLRNHILQERGWEFYSEAMRREDLIRHGKFISKAIERGKNAEDYHLLYPIPQAEIDANTKLNQNPGY